MQVDIPAEVASGRADRDRDSRPGPRISTENPTSRNHRLGSAEVLTEAFRSPAVNVQVNAALGLGMLGKARVGVGLAALHGARTGGDARTREAVRKALEMISPSGKTGPAQVAVDGFEDRFLSASELDAHKAELGAVAVDDFLAYLQDGRDVVRANAAGALGVLGAAALPAATTLGVRLRDDARGSGSPPPRRSTRSATRRCSRPPATWCARWAMPTSGSPRPAPA